jgi:hypothetical protein
METLKTTHKINVNRGLRRICFDNKRLAKYGFAAGTIFRLTKHANRLELNSNTIAAVDEAPQELRTVSARPNGDPNIYIIGKIVNEVFPNSTHVDVTWDDGHMVIRAHEEAEKCAMCGIELDDDYCPACNDEASEVLEDSEQRLRLMENGIG